MDEDTWKMLQNSKIEKPREEGSFIRCTICHNIPMNVQIGRCLCRYCRKCLTEYQVGLGNFCPGNSEKCKLTDLSDITNVSPDCETNTRTSMLTIKCPDTKCQYQSELINMEQHLRVCQQQRDTFSKPGCKNDELHNDEMFGHLDTENETYNKLIAGLVNNLANEIIRVESSFSTKINSLHEDLLRTKESCMTIQKLHYKEFLEQNKILREDSHKIGLMFRKIQKENQILKHELENCMYVMENLKAETKIAGMKLESELGSLVWKIDKVFDKKCRQEIVSSDYFHSKEGHKMILYFHPYGCSKSVMEDHVSVKVGMSNYQCGETTQFDGKVSVEIFDQQTGEPLCNVEKNCVISKGFSSSSFNFIYSKLHPDRGLKNDSIVFRCCLYTDR